MRSSSSQTTSGAAVPYLDLQAPPPLSSLQDQMNHVGRRPVLPLTSSHIKPDSLPKPTQKPFHHQKQPRRPAQFKQHLPRRIKTEASKKHHHQSHPAPQAVHPSVTPTNPRYCILPATVNTLGQSRHLKSLAHGKMADKDDDMSPWFLYLDASETAMFPQEEDNFNLMTTPEDSGCTYDNGYTNVDSSNTKVEVNSPGESHQYGNYRHESSAPASPESPLCAPPMALSPSPPMPADQELMSRGGIVTANSKAEGTNSVTTAATFATLATAHEQPESQVSAAPSPGFDDPVTTRSGWNSTATTPVHIDMLDNNTSSNNALPSSFHSITSSTPITQHPPLLVAKSHGLADDTAAHAATMFPAQQPHPHLQWVDLPSCPPSSVAVQTPAGPVFFKTSPSVLHTTLQDTLHNAASPMPSTTSSVAMTTSGMMNISSSSSNMIASHGLPDMSGSPFYGMMPTSDPFATLPMHGLPLPQAGPLGMPRLSVQGQVDFHQFSAASQCGDQGVVWPCTPSTSNTGVTTGAAIHHSGGGVTPDSHNVTAAANSLSHPSQIAYISPSGLSSDSNLVFGPNNTSIQNLNSISGGERAGGGGYGATVEDHPHGGAAEEMWDIHTPGAGVVAPQQVRLQPTPFQTPGSSCSPPPHDGAHQQYPALAMLPATNIPPSFPSSASPSSAAMMPVEARRHRLPSAPRSMQSNPVQTDCTGQRNPKTTLGDDQPACGRKNKRVKSSGPYSRTPLQRVSMSTRIHGHTHHGLSNNAHHDRPVGSLGAMAQTHSSIGTGEDSNMSGMSGTMNGYHQTVPIFQTEAHGGPDLFPAPVAPMGRSGTSVAPSSSSFSSGYYDVNEPFHAASTTTTGSVISTPNEGGPFSEASPRFNNSSALLSGPGASSLPIASPTAASAVSTAAAGAAANVAASSAAQAMKRQLEDRMRKDQFLLEHKRAGLTYKEIRKLGGFTEAESTLRGRHRTLTKPKEERVRKPVWSSRDDKLLRDAVRRLARGREVGPNSAIKISWKSVGDYIYEHGGSYHFGNTTCRKRWDFLIQKQ